VLGLYSVDLRSRFASPTLANIRKPQFAASIHSPSHHHFHTPNPNPKPNPPTPQPHSISDQPPLRPQEASAPPPSATATATAPTADEREWLLADKQQQLVEELFDVPREELVLVLEQAGQAVDPLESKVRLHSLL